LNELVPRLIDSAAAEPYEFSHDLEVVIGPAPAEDTTSMGHRRRAQSFATLAGAAAMACAVAVVTVLIVHQQSNGRSSTTPQHLSGDLTKVCSAPSTGFARLWEDETGPVDYSGRVLAGHTYVPALSMYVSDGPPGQGVLCVSQSAQIGITDPIAAATTVQSGNIAYLGTHQGQPYGAVRPGVARVTITNGDSLNSQTFSLDSTDQMSRLQSLGDGWAAFDSPYGYSTGPAGLSLTVRAYTATGRQVGSTVLRLPGTSASH
jgi:hypothetical protein